MPSLPLVGEDLDKLPYPDFDDFFAQGSTQSYSDRIVSGLVLETSRGCWWGAKQHCTFCGLNGDTMAFRSKSAPRAFEEITALVKRYGARPFAVADNILDMKYFKTLLPMLAEKPTAEFFYEIKANLSKPQVRLMARSNITCVQPGIESLSDTTLRLMRKGTTKLQNVQLLKWCADFGIDVGWNYLFGFPGEVEAEIRQIARETESLHHLDPPSGARTIRMDRFSPYFNNPGEFGLDPVAPAEPYRHVYSLAEEPLRRISCFFRSEYFERMSGSTGFTTARAMVDKWQNAHWRSYLLAIRRKTSLIIIDTRLCRQRLWRRLCGLQRRVYEYCDRAHSLTEIRKTMEPASDRQIDSALNTLVRARLMLQSNGRYLSLGVDARPNDGRFGASPSFGHLKPPKQQPGKLRREVLRVITCRVTPWIVARSLVRRTSDRIRKTARTMLPVTLRATVTLLHNGA